MIPPRTPSDGDDPSPDDPLDRLLAAYEKAEPFAELRELDAPDDGDAVAPPDDDLSGVVNLAPTPEVMTPGRTSRLAEGAKRREERRLEAERREAEKRERAQADARQRERERAERERREAEARERKQAIAEQRNRERLERAQHTADRKAQQREERRRQKEEREERRRVEREEREAVELERARERAAKEEDRRREKELRDVDRREQRRLAQERRARQKDERRRQRREERERAAVEREERKRLLARVREEERREREHRAFLEAERERLRKEEVAAVDAAPPASAPEADVEPAPAPAAPTAPPDAPPAPTSPVPPPLPTPPPVAPPTPPASTFQAPPVTPSLPGDAAVPRLAFERVRPLPDGWRPSPHGGPQYGTVAMPAPGAASRAHVLTPAGRPSAFRFSGGGRDNRPPSRSRRTVAAAAVVATAVAASVGGWWYVALDRIDHPDHWDPRVFALVSFVEAERGRAFDHPVAIEVVTAPELQARWAEAAAPSADLPGEARDTAVLRSLGLVDGSPRRGDLVATLPVSTAGIAFYSPADRSITMTGELDVVTRSALVAALTMALYDQAFGLPAHADKPAERLALAAANGGAAATQEAYLHAVSPTDRAAFDAAASMAAASNRGPLSELERLRVDTARWAHPALARWAPARDGDHLVDDPPTTEEQLLTPLAYLLADEAVDVEQPDLEPGERRVASGELGALHWLVMLAGRIDPMTALSAADGWAGDRWVAFDRDGRTCTRVAWIGDTERDRGEMREALERWVAAMPAADGRVTVAGDTLVLTSCDPGPDAPLDRAGIEEAATLALARTSGYVPVSALLEATGPGHGWCLADTALRRLGSVPEPPVELALTRFLADAGQRLVVETECV